MRNSGLNDIIAKIRRQYYHCREIVLTGEELK